MSDDTRCGSPVTCASSVWSCTLPEGHDGKHVNHTQGMADVSWSEDNWPPARPTADCAPHHNED